LWPQQASALAHQQRALACQAWVQQLQQLQQQQGLGTALRQQQGLVRQAAAPALLPMAAATTTTRGSGSGG
jgi:hypothetical protein